MAEAASWRDLAGLKRTNKPWLDGLPRFIFVGDMADSFSADITFEYLRQEVVETVSNPAGQRHVWLWLTKRPQRMARFSSWLLKQSIPWPPNLWAGTSVTTQARTSRIDALLKAGVEQAIRFVSIEPQWEHIDLRPWLSRLDWVIQGGQSGSHDHPFAIEWADDLRLQCRDHHVPYFLKQLGSCIAQKGEKVRGHRGHGGDWEKWPRQLRVRQMPICIGKPRNQQIRQRCVANRARRQSESKGVSNN
jgi:protein gp37